MSDFCIRILILTCRYYHILTLWCQLMPETLYLLVASRKFLRTYCISPKNSRKRIRTKKVRYRNTAQSKLTLNISNVYRCRKMCQILFKKYSMCVKEADHILVRRGVYSIEKSLLSPEPVNRTPEPEFHFRFHRNQPFLHSDVMVPDKLDSYTIFLTKF
jgi:hypothetical protein